MDKNIKKIVELKIDESDILLDDLGLEIISLVNEPAIEVNWKAFNSEQNDEKTNEVELKDITFDDYSFTSEEQKQVLEIAKEAGETIGPDDIYFELKQENFGTIGDFLKGLSVINSLTTWQAAKDEGETFYRYGGRPAERNFCLAMQRINRVYTFEDIQGMRGLNNEFGHKQNPYSIWNYKGGLYCHHRWQKLKIFRGNNNNKVIIDLGPEEGLPGIAPIDMEGRGVHPSRLSKQQFSIDDEKKIVVGPVLIPNKMILRQDEMGEPYYVYFSRETIRKIAEKFFRESKHNNTDINHDEVITKENTLLESWIVEDSVYDKSYIYGYRLPKGTLMASYKINNEQTWDLIKEGKLNGFSAAGFFIEKSKREKETEMTLQKIIDLINEVETN
jgi:hypothetical protein